MNDLLKKAQKTAIKDPAAYLPLNQLFWTLVEKNYTRGEIRELFFGDKEASKKKELQYIPGDPAFMGWQQLLLTIDNQKVQQKQMKDQTELQAKQQELQSQQAEEEQRREKEKHELEVSAHRDAAAHSVVSASLKDTAKQYGAASKPLEVGGKIVANPINVLGDKKD
jgi:glucan-binding YG repeat protein